MARCCWSSTMAGPRRSTGTSASRSRATCCSRPSARAARWRCWRRRRIRTTRIERAAAVGPGCTGGAPRLAASAMAGRPRRRARGAAARPGPGPGKQRLAQRRRRPRPGRTGRGRTAGRAAASARATAGSCRIGRRSAGGAAPGRTRGRDRGRDRGRPRRTRPGPPKSSPWAPAANRGPGSGRRWRQAPPTPAPCWKLPPDLRNRIARVELAPDQGIAGSFLLDERWRRRSVGLVGAPRSAGDQPLLAELYFIDRALRPFADVREGPLMDLLGQPLSLLVMADTGGLDPRNTPSSAPGSKPAACCCALRAPSSPPARTTSCRPGCAPAIGPWRRALLVRAAGDGAVSARQPVRRPAGQRRGARRRQVLAEPGPDLAARPWRRSPTARPW